MMKLAEKSSEVRNHFSEFFDTVVRDRPRFVSRNRDVVSAFSVEHIAVMLEPLYFQAHFELDENHEYVGTVAEIDDIVVIGSTKDEALSEIAKDLLEYAEEYLTDSFKLYFNAPNRRKHFPYVLKVAVQPNFEAVKRLIRD